MSIIDFRGYKSVQLEAYYDCYEKNNKKYKWLSFFDFDEFLELKPKSQKIKQYLTSKIFNNCTNIKTNWVMYTDNNLIFYQNKTIYERFKTPNYNISPNIHVKSTVRGNLTVNYWKNAIDPHTSKFGFSSCSSSGKKIKNTSPYNIPPDFDNSLLRHYYTKTIEEFILKIKRGPAAIVNDIPDSFFINKLNLFFLINNKTYEKLDVIKKNLNITYNITNSN